MAITRTPFADRGSVELGPLGGGVIKMVHSPPANVDVWVEYVAVVTSFNGMDPMAPGSGPIPYVAVFSGPEPRAAYFEGGTKSGDMDAGDGLIRVVPNDFLFVVFYAGPVGAVGNATIRGYQLRDT